MRFNLSLTRTGTHALLTFNYQYPLSAAIYKIISRADEAYADFLHNKGYGDGLKSFKLFTFSDLKAPFKIRNDGLQLLNRQAELVVSFHLPQAAESFIKGLFMNQELEIADRQNRVVFSITQVTAQPALAGISQSGNIQELLLQPLSPVVCGVKNEQGNYSFLSPEHPDFVRQLLYNWQEKYKALYGIEETERAFAGVAMEVVFFRQPPRSRLVTIKAETPAETKIRGFTNFRLKVRGSNAALELLVNAGAGIYSSLGMGCVQVVPMQEIVVKEKPPAIQTIP